MTGKEIAAKLRQARDLMNDTGAHWIQGRSATSARGEWVRFCSIGAIRYVVNGDPYEDSSEEDYLTEALATQIPEDEAPRGYEGPDKIVFWNDRADRTWSEISETFEQAAKAAEAT
jgi:hypothetical protein